jgi:hypothetical protein
VESTLFAWPKGFEPDEAAVYVRNERKFNVAPEIVWQWLVRAPLWPTWYANTKGVRIETGDHRILGADSKFEWNVLGLSLKSTIEKFEHGKQLGWIADNDLIHACHFWDIRATSGGCYVVTEESQNGFLPSFFFFILRPMMFRANELWLSRLDDQARTGPPPP